MNCDVKICFLMTLGNPCQGGRDPWTENLCSVGMFKLLLLRISQWRFPMFPVADKEYLEMSEFWPQSEPETIKWLPPPAPLQQVLSAPLGRVVVVLPWEQRRLSFRSWSLSHGGEEETRIPVKLFLSHPSTSQTCTDVYRMPWLRLDVRPGVVVDAPWDRDAKLGSEHLGFIGWILVGRIGMELSLVW